jgi:hypothetical protein
MASRRVRVAGIWVIAPLFVAGVVIVGLAVAPSPVSLGESEAHLLLATASAPRGATPIYAAPPGLNAPPEGIGCVPSFDAYQLYSVPSATNLSSYVRTHVREGWAIFTTGQYISPTLTTHYLVVTVRSTGSRVRFEKILYSFVPLSDGSLGLRVDAELTTAHSECASAPSASAASGPGMAGHQRVTPGTPVVDLGRVYPSLDNGGIGTFGSTPLPGPRTPNVLPNP